MDLIVDGYNLIGGDQGLGGALEPKRNWLVRGLPRIKESFNIVIVFSTGGAPAEARRLKEKMTVSQWYTRG